MAKDMPAQPYVELQLGDIDEGALLAEINAELAKAHAAIVRAETERDGDKFTASLTIKIKMLRSGRETFAIETDVASKLPRPKRISLVKEKNGRLLCPLGGASGEHPDQLRLIYDEFGRGTHQLDKRSGTIEPVERVEPVGKIGAGGAAG